MIVRKRWSRAARFGSPAAALLVGGCLASLERNLDFLLSPEALENTLELPFSSVAPFVHYLLRLVI